MNIRPWTVGLEDNMAKTSTVLKDNPITLDDLYAEIQDLLGVMEEIKEQQAEIIEKLDNVGLPGNGFRVFDVDEQ